MRPHGRRSCRVPNSVMPKGVEHSIVLAIDAATIGVSNSVMPKGVEHSRRLRRRRRLPACRIQ